jgi:hypothetical protein
VHSYCCTIDRLFDVDSRGFVWAGHESDPNRRLCALREGGVVFMGELCDVTVQHPSLRSIVSTLSLQRLPMPDSSVAHERTDDLRENDRTRYAIMCIVLLCISEHRLPVRPPDDLRPHAACWRACRVFNCQGVLRLGVGLDQTTFDRTRFAQIGRWDEGQRRILCRLGLNSLASRSALCLVPL